MWILAWKFNASKIKWGSFYEFDIETIFGEVLLKKNLCSVKNKNWFAISFKSTMKRCLRTYEFFFLLPR